jgi:hypothetical protein
MTAKWCTHCRKDDHNDSECWSTRMCTCNNYPHQPNCGTPPAYGPADHGAPFALKTPDEVLELIRRVINEHREVLEKLKDR